MMRYPRRPARRGVPCCRRGIGSRSIPGGTGPPGRPRRWSGSPWSAARPPSLGRRASPGRPQGRGDGPRRRDPPGARLPGPGRPRLVTPPRARKGAGPMTVGDLLDQADATMAGAASRGQPLVEARCRMELAEPVPPPDAAKAEGEKGRGPWSTSPGAPGPDHPDALWARGVQVYVRGLRWEAPGVQEPGSPLMRPARRPPPRPRPRAPRTRSPSWPTGRRPRHPPPARRGRGPGRQGPRRRRAGPRPRAPRHARRPPRPAFVAPSAAATTPAEALMRPAGGQPAGPRAAHPGLAGPRRPRQHPPGERQARRGHPGRRGCVRGREAALRCRREWALGLRSSDRPLPCAGGNSPAIRDVFLPLDRRDPQDPRPAPDPYDNRATHLAVAARALVTLPDTVPIDAGLAARAAEEASALSDGKRGGISLALAYYRAGRLDQAIAALRRAKARPDREDDGVEDAWPWPWSMPTAARSTSPGTGTTRPRRPGSYAVPPRLTSRDPLEEQVEALLGVNPRTPREARARFPPWPASQSDRSPGTIDRPTSRGLPPPMTPGGAPRPPITAPDAAQGQGRGLGHGLDVRGESPHPVRVRRVAQVRDPVGAPAGDGHRVLRLIERVGQGGRRREERPRQPARDVDREHGRHPRGVDSELEPERVREVVVVRVVPAGLREAGGAERDVGGRRQAGPIERGERGAAAGVRAPRHGIAARDLHRRREVEVAEIRPRVAEIGEARRR